MFGSIAGRLAQAGLCSVVSHMQAVCIILNTHFAGPLQLKEFNFSYFFLRQ